MMLRDYNLWTADHQLGNIIIIIIIAGCYWKYIFTQPISELVTRSTKDGSIIPLPPYTFMA